MSMIVVECIDKGIFRSLHLFYYSLPPFFCLIKMEDDDMMIDVCSKLNWSSLDTLFTIPPFPLFFLSFTLFALKWSCVLYFIFSHTIYVSFFIYITYTYIYILYLLLPVAIIDDDHPICLCRANRWCSNIKWINLVPNLWPWCNHKSSHPLNYFKYFVWV